MPSEFSNAHWMKAKFDSSCNECEDSISEGDDIVFAPVIKKAYCSACGDHIVPRDKDEEASESVAEVRARLKEKKNAKSVRRFK